jgi:uncharacterized protein (DUF1684 family)
MKRMRHGAVIGIAGLLWLAACSSKPAASWADALLAARAEKDRLFRESPDSPLTPEAKRAFTGLSYFPLDETYRVPASLRPVPDGEASVVRMPTSTGQLRDMVRVGRLEFVLKGQALRLTAFVEAGDTRRDRLFVPFADLTTGRETYAGGRYLDLERSPSGIYLVDFNRAYHPYCLYNPKYDCPFPPPENRLPVPVRAGERLPPAP